MEVGTIMGQNATMVAEPLRQQQMLGKDAFLQLLVTQLTNQDPLEPMDDTEFVAQLAQFSALEQMTYMTSGIEDLRVIQAISFVGKKIDAITFDGGRVTGVVNEVMFTDAEPMLIVDDIPVTLDNVIRVFASESEMG